MKHGNLMSQIDSPEVEQAQQHRLGFKKAFVRKLSSSLHQQNRQKLDANIVNKPSTVT